MRKPIHSKHTIRTAQLVSVTYEYVPLNLLHVNDKKKILISLLLVTFDAFVVVFESSKSIA